MVPGGTAVVVLRRLKKKNMAAAMTIAPPTPPTTPPTIAPTLLFFLDVPFVSVPGVCVGKPKPVVPVVGTSVKEKPPAGEEVKPPSTVECVIGMALDALEANTKSGLFLACSASAASILKLLPVFVTSRKPHDGTDTS